MTAIALDADQQAAVDHGEGPCLVLAGPGSGKTRVIVQRFLRLCAEGVGAERQLVLSYNRRAAEELRERAEALHGALPDGAPLTNYHSFAQRVVRDWGWLLGVTPAFRIADEAERWLHAEAVLNQLRPRTLWNPLRPDDLIAPLLRIIKTAKQELVTPERYAQWAEQRLEGCGDDADRALLVRHHESALVYGALQDRYRRHGVLDFEDTILLAEELIRSQPAARRAVAEPIEHLMVDEFQDTDYAQSRLVEALMQGRRNILVVADDDQSIYKFRGASRANLDRFEAAHPDCRRLLLSRNYRSTGRIVAASRRLIVGASSGTRIEKSLTAVRDDGVAVEVWDADSVHDEMSAIAAECARLIQAGQSAAEIALLFRRHADMQEAIRALQSQGVPYRIQGGRGFFQQPEIKDVMALLMAIADPGNSQALLRCLLLPAWRVTSRGRVALVEACQAHDLALRELICRDPALGLDSSDAETARRCVAALDELCSRAIRDDVREVLFAALEASELLADLEGLSQIERLQYGANLNKFGELLERFAEWNDDLRLGRALVYLEALRRNSDSDALAAIEPVEEGVVLLTAHAAKGLEWPCVVIPQCSRSRWPGRPRVDSQLALPDELVPEQGPGGDTLIDEERRLLYVAATRARDRLIFSLARYPSGAVGRRPDEPSPFLAALEAGPEGGPEEQGSTARRVAVPRSPHPSVPAARRRGTPLEGRPSVSVAGLRDFRECPRRYAYAHVYRLPRPPSARRWYGELIHAVLRSAAARAAVEPLDGEGVCQLWAAAWESSPGRRGVHPELRALGEQQLRHYLASPGWRPAEIVETEQPFALRTARADVRGRFDRIDRGASGTALVVDYKTGPPRNASREAGDLQVRAYAVALSQRERSDDMTVELHRLQTTEVLTVNLGRAELERAFRHVSATAAEVVEAQQLGAFPPRPSPWSCGHCDFRTVCDEGRRTATRR